MATYTIDKRPKRLREGDKVIFEVNGGKTEYRVAWDYLCLVGGEDVFGPLGLGTMGKGAMALRCFGYESTNLSGWPSAKVHDFAAHCRLVNALYDLIEEREGKMAESNPDKGDNEPGIFMGYDWVPADEDLNDTSELSGSERYATFEEAAEAAQGGSEAPFFVFKLYAVDAKKYSYKLTQVD